MCIYQVVITLAKRSMLHWTLGLVDFDKMVLLGQGAGSWYIIMLLYTILRPYLYITVPANT